MLPAHAILYPAFLHYKGGVTIHWSLENNNNLYEKGKFKKSGKSFR